VVAGLLEEDEEHSAVLRQLNLLRRNESAHEISFTTLRDRVHQPCRQEEGVSSGLRRWQGGLSETELYTMAMASGRAATVFLPVAWCLVAERISPELLNARTVNPRILSIGRIFQIGLEHVILPKIEEFAREGRTLREVMAELVTRTVQQHLRVAWTRFAPPQGKDVSVLIADNDIWARNNGFKPGRTDSRLWVAISWLNQLRLIDEDGLTATGSRILDLALTILTSSGSFSSFRGSNATKGGLRGRSILTALARKRRTLRRWRVRGCRRRAVSASPPAPIGGRSRHWDWTMWCAR